jgi:hypothetical protein
MLRYLPALLLSVLCLSLAGCDNVAKAFGPGATPDPGTGTAESKIQIVREAGDAKNGRPTVKNVAPKGSAWPTTVPIVIEFSESIYENSILPTSSTAQDARIILRVKGTTQPITCIYDFVAQGRVLVMRPGTGLTNQNNPVYEVVMFPDGTDVDGVPFLVSGTETVLAEFECNQSDTIHDGRILTTYPRDNARDANRETAYYVFFDRPVNAISLTANNLLVRPRGGSALAGAAAPVLQVLNEDDGRIIRFVPDDALAAGTEYQLVVDDTLTFGADGTLDFGGRTPYAIFNTVRPQAPTAVHVGNPTTGFADKINRNNYDTLTLKVTTPADAEVGDRVVARIYGGDRSTAPTGDLAQIERTATVTTAGAHEVTIDFTGLLGTLARPKFDDGSVTFCAQMQRGSEHSGFAQSDSADLPLFDITPPTMVTAGAAASASGTDIYTDQEYLAYYGVASEQVHSADLVDGTAQTAEMFGAASDGSFLIKPVLLGRLTAPRSYGILLTDLAGNVAVAEATGNIVQRGVITGTIAGTLTVEAYDHTTLAPIANATVLVDPGVPLKPAVGQLVGTTNASGRATFTGLGGSQYTVTIVRAGYDLVTLYATGASFVSLPLRPTTGATASLRGNILFQASGGARALVGSSAIDDPLALSVLTSANAPTTIPETAIVPNRPQLIAAFGGLFEATSVPTFNLIGYQMLGPALITPTAPVAPAAAGTTVQTSIPLISSAALATSLPAAFSVDFAQATGLDTANLVGGGPLVRAMLSVQGFGQQVANGAGLATLGSGASYHVNATFGSIATLGFGSFGATNLIACQARDTAGRVSRYREVVNSFVGVPVMILIADVPAIPAVSSPSGAITGSPAVTFEDRLDPASATVGSPIAIAEISAVDGAGRKWTVFQVDNDAASGVKTVQFPDLATPNVAGLQSGSWTVRAENRTAVALYSGDTAASLVLSERLRSEVTYARSAAVTFTIQ